MSQFKYVIWKRIRWFFMICFFILVMIFYFSEKGEERIIPDINDTSKIKSSEQTSVKKFTDSQGRFRIPDSRGSVFQNAMTLYAQAPGYMPGFCTITNMSPDIPPVFIKMRKGVRIHGTVYSSSHEPVSHAEWEIRNVNSKTQPTGHNRYTDARGRYDKVVTHNWIGEEVYVYVFSQKYGYGMVVLKIPEDGGDIERDITLCPGISVTAWVLDQYGEGIRGHEINARTSEMSGYVFSCFRRTDIEGSAVFDNLPKALFEFSIKDLRNDLTKEIILKETLDLSNVDSSREFIFSLDKPGDTLRVVSGSVTDDEGNPIKDVLVDSYALMKETKTDAEGQYRIEATSSEDMKEPRIEFSKTGYLRFRRYFKPDQVEDHLDVIMKKAFSTVFYGTIVTRNGEIPTEAEIEVWGSIHLLDFRRVSLGKGGTFEFRVDSRKYSGLDRVRLYSNDPSNMNMETGTYYYIKAKDYVHGSGCSQAIKSVGGDSVGPFEIILSWGMLKGYLRDGKTGDAVSNGLISSYELSSMHYDIYNMKKEGSGTYTYSDQSGYFEISPLPPGSSKIYFYHPDYWIQERIAPEIKQENLEVEWNPVLDPCASLEGKIINSDGIPIGNVEVHISNGVFTKSVASDDQGIYSFEGIPPGKYSFYYHIAESYKNCPYSIRREEINFQEPGQIILDFHIPQLVPAVMQLKSPKDASGESWMVKSVILQPLYPAEFTSLDFYFPGMDSDHSYSMFLPPGKYLMRTGSDKASEREIEIHPTGENRITVEYYK